MASGSEKALRLLKGLPRVGLDNIRYGRYREIKIAERQNNVNWGKKRGQSGHVRKGNLPPLGTELGRSQPFHMRIPKEPYYKEFDKRRQLPYISLLQVQRLVDMGYIDPAHPVDLTTLSNTPMKKIDPANREFGFNLTDEGADIFAAKLNIEVQHASELAIAAIEKNGGTITTKYYDLLSVEAMVDPEAFFEKGIPIPYNKLPPREALQYYSDPGNRGYLADPGLIDDKRFGLAQKYGYKLPELDQDVDFKMLARRKRPEQIWYGLEPGWVVNLTDEVILRPKSQEAVDYYEAEHIYGGSMNDIKPIEEQVKIEKEKATAS